MKIISALGGTGSTYIIRALQSCNYPRGASWLKPKRLRSSRLAKRRLFRDAIDTALKLAGFYKPVVKVLVRPDVFWTERDDKMGVYDPAGSDFDRELREFAEFIIDTRVTRSAGLPLRLDMLDWKSHESLVSSYIEAVEYFERDLQTDYYLVAGHWGEYGILKHIGAKTIYLIRDPFNSIISFSKSIRHEDNFLRRGYESPHDKNWIDAYLHGPIHYWVNHVRIALSDSSGTIVRYGSFRHDWRNLDQVPDISGEFSYRHNSISDTFSEEMIEYVLEETRDLCQELDLSIPGINLSH